MDISASVSTDFVQVPSTTEVSTIRGRFDEGPALPAVLVVDGDRLLGVVTRKQLISSHHEPTERARSVVRPPPRVSRTEDVRETARLMVESGLPLLPVFDGSTLYGVVTARGLLSTVRSNLSALDVADVYTRDIVSVAPETTLGEVVHLIRTHPFTRVPVIDGNEAVGMVSIFDLVRFTTRKMDREQGGSAPGFDEHGGGGSQEGFNTHGGYGERSGTKARMLDLPARDFMNSPVSVISVDAGLDEAFDRIVEKGHGSLIVTAAEADTPIGIVTTTDLLRALTWTPEDRITVQVFGADLLDDLGYDEIVGRVEAIAKKDRKRRPLEVNVVFHRHQEKLRGTPLLLATIRLFTDGGRFSGSGEGYGARAAFDQAGDVLERNVLKEKERRDDRNRVGKRREETEALLDWWIEP